MSTWPTRLILAALVLLAGCGNDESEGQISGTFALEGPIVTTEPYMSDSTQLSQVWLSIPASPITDTSRIRFYAELSFKSEQDRSVTIPWMSTRMAGQRCSDEPMLLAIADISATAFTAYTIWDRCNYCRLECTDWPKKSTLTLEGQLAAGVLHLRMIFDGWTQDLILVSVPDDTPPVQKPIVPVMRDGRYRLAEGAELAASLYWPPESLARFADGLTTSEITSITAIDYEQYWDLITTNVRGTEAAIYIATGLHFSYESTTGTGFGNYVFFYAGNALDPIESHGVPFGGQYAAASTQGILEAYAIGGCYEKIRLGTIDYWEDGTGFDLDTGIATFSYIRDDKLPPHDDAEISCSTAEHDCKIQKRRKTEQGNSPTPQILSAPELRQPFVPLCTLAPRLPAGQ